MSEAAWAAPLARCATVVSDFNGDGYADLAIGEPWRYTEGGGIQVTYGSATGLRKPGSQFFDQTSFSSLTPTPYDGFGQALATGDFNGDCYADVAVAIPNQARVAILYGSPTGLTAAADQVIATDALGPGDYQGYYALTAADFNHDGRDDLAIGMPSGDAVGVVYGSYAGLTMTGHRLFGPHTPGMPQGGGVHPLFGEALASGDLTGDGYADLAIGDPENSYGGHFMSGSVTVLKGGANGLDVAGSKLWTQDTAGVPGISTKNGDFGQALAMGDVTGDGRDDLAIGAPGQNSQNGAVTVLRGSATDLLTTTGAQLFSESTPGVPGTAGRVDWFGESLGMGDLNGDGHSDLIVGAPQKDVAGLHAAGTVTVLYGQSAGVGTVGAQLWSQNSPGVDGKAEVGDSFGWSLCALPIRTSAHADLVVGDPFEMVGTIYLSGAVAVLPGSAHGVTAVGNQLLGPDNLAGGTEAFAQAGLAIA